MKRFELRPDLRTAGGEVNDILVDGRFAGTMTLVWREGGRLSGSVQLDRDALREKDKRLVLDRINDYVDSFVLASGVTACEVFVTYSPFEQLIVTADDPEEEAGAWTDADEETGVREAEYELVLVGKKRNRLHYHVYDGRSRWIAEAHLRAEDGRVTGTVQWRSEPDEDEIELVTELIVTDFDEDSVDEFLLDHRHGDELLETVELAHEDEPAAKAESGKKAKPARRGESNFTAKLIRDDGDTLTYEIRSKADGNRSIGMATVDIRERRLTGFIDFRERRHADDAGAIAAVLMRELDKEKDYDGLNLSLMYRNRLIDEFIVENETVH